MPQIYFYIIYDNTMTLLDRASFQLYNTISIIVYATLVIRKKRYLIFHSSNNTAVVVRKCFLRSPSFVGPVCMEELLETFSISCRTPGYQPCYLNRISTKFADPDSKVRHSVVRKCMLIYVC